MKSTWKFVLAHKVASGIVVVAVLAPSIYFFSSSNGSEAVIRVERGNLVEEIVVTGEVKPARSVDLAFERAGRVSYVAHDVGAHVSAGTLLAKLSSADLEADVAEAAALLKSAEAKLAELKAGTRAEEISIAEVKGANAEKALEDAKANLAATIRDSYIKADDAVRNKSDQLFSNPRTQNPQLNYTGDLQLEIDMEAARPRVESVLTAWEKNLSSTDSTEARSTLADVRGFLDLMIRLLSALGPTTGLSQATLDDYRADVATGRTNVSTAMLNLTAAEEKTRTAESNLALAKEELSLKRAGTRVETIAQAEADVEKARAAHASTKAELAKAAVVSPLSGTVTKQDAKVGEIAAANVVVTSVISDAKFQVEAKVPEADVGTISVGDRARVALDAYHMGEIFNARVIKIDPASTLVEGVATYLTTLEFDAADERVRSGMTASITITTDERTGVLAISRRAVTMREGKSYVRVGKEEREIVTGLHAAGGFVEAVSGLSEGETIVIAKEN